MATTETNPCAGVTEIPKIPGLWGVWVRAGHSRVWNAGAALGRSLQVSHPRVWVHLGGISCCQESPGRCGERQGKSSSGSWCLSQAPSLGITSRLSWRPWTLLEIVEKWIFFFLWEPNRAAICEGIPWNVHPEHWFLWISLNVHPVKDVQDLKHDPWAELLDRAVRPGCAELLKPRCHQESDPKGWGQGALEQPGIGGAVPAHDRGWNKKRFKIPSNLNCSMIPWLGFAASELECSDLGIKLWCHLYPPLEMLKQNKN